MTADVLCDEGVVKESARFQLRRGAMFPAAGDGGGKTISHVGKLKSAGKLAVWRGCAAGGRWPVLCRRRCRSSKPKPGESGSRKS